MPAPAVPPESLQIQVHETMVANTAISALGGLRVTDRRAASLVEELTGSVPDEFTVEEDDHWSITFDLNQPLRVLFDDNQVTIACQLRQLARGQQAVDRLTRIAATYAVAIQNDRILLTRVGDVSVTYPDIPEEQRLSVTELRDKIVKGLESKHAAQLRA